MSQTREFHSELQHLAMLACHAIAAEVRVEYQLPNRKIADIICRLPNNDIVIVEVKTTLAQEMITQSLRKYEQYAHYVVMAIPEYEYERHTAPTGIVGQFHAARSVGWISIRTGGAIIQSLGTRRRIAPSLTALSSHRAYERADNNNEYYSQFGRPR